MSSWTKNGYIDICFEKKHSDYRFQNFGKPCNHIFFDQQQSKQLQHSVTSRSLTEKKKQIHWLLASRSSSVAIWMASNSSERGLLVENNKIQSGQKKKKNIIWLNLEDVEIDVLKILSLNIMCKNVPCDKILSLLTHSTAGTPKY